MIYLYSAWPWGTKVVRLQRLRGKTKAERPGMLRLDPGSLSAMLPQVYQTSGREVDHQLVEKLNEFIYQYWLVKMQGKNKDEAIPSCLGPCLEVADQTTIYVHDRLAGLRHKGQWSHMKGHGAFLNCGYPQIIQVMTILVVQPTVSGYRNLIRQTT
jgi:hypothetical protein